VTEYTQAEMVHVLPPAPLVERAGFLLDRCRGRRVVHVGFADHGCRDLQDRNGTWLHAHLAGVAAELVGVDLDEPSVARARAEGYEAHAADCTDPGAVAALGVAPAEVVVAGEVIEHLGDPAGFFEAVHALVAPGGELVVTTPNAYGLTNVLTGMLRREVNHPDHVVIFSRRTLEALADRHGWRAVDTAVYVPVVKPQDGAPVRVRAMEAAARLGCAVERGLGRLGRPYAADGLIMTFRSHRG
jgi:SAM-dependent methyltransferase